MPAIKTRLISEPTAVTIASAAYAGYTTSPTLASFLNQSNYTALFDQYRVLSLGIHFIFPNAIITASAITSWLAIAPDFDAAAAPANTVAGAASVMQKPGSKVQIGQGIIHHRIVPRIHVDVQADAAFTTDASTNHWITTLDNDVNLYGFVYVLKSLAPTTDYIFQYYLDIEVEFRGQHSALPGVTAPIQKVQQEFTPDEYDLLNRLSARLSTVSKNPIVG